MANESPLNRMDLHNQFKQILGNNNVYFQPPESLKLQYPCIVYSIANYNEIHANNDTYLLYPSYTATLIHNNPDNDVVERLILSRLGKFDRYYSKDNLHHYVFTFFIRRK